MKSYRQYVHSPSLTLHHTVIVSRIIIAKVINFTIRTSKRQPQTIIPMTTTNHHSHGNHKPSFPRQPQTIIPMTTTNHHPHDNHKPSFPWQTHAINHLPQMHTHQSRTQQLHFYQSPTKVHGSRQPTTNAKISIIRSTNTLISINRHTAINH